MIVTGSYCYCFGNIRIPLPNNYPVSISAKTSKDQSSDFEELPKRAKNKKRGNDCDSGEEEFDINFTSNSDELNLEYPSDEGASEHTKRLKKGTTNCVLRVDVAL